MAHIDFVVAPRPGTLLALGWTARGDSRAPVLRLPGREVAPVRSERHLREDMAPAEAQGMLWRFDADPAALARADICLAGARYRLGSDRLEDAARRFIETALDGAFWGTLWAMARGTVPGFGGGWSARLAGRLDSRRFPCLEAPEAALGIDHADHSAALGFGLLQGWALGAGALPEVTALLAGSDGIVPVGVTQGVLETPSLGAFAGRYRVSGADGFAAVLPASVPAGARLLVLIRDGSGQVQGLTAAIEARGGEAMADCAMETEARARRLGGTILPLLAGPEAQRQPVAVPTGAGGAGGRLAVLLDHDAPPLALRDALRLLAATLGEPFRLHLAQAPCARARAGLRGALAELPEGAVRLGAPVSPASLDWTLEEADRVLFARSSALFQLRGWGRLLQQLGAGGAQAAVTVLAPAARLHGGEAAAAAAEAALRGGEPGIVAAAGADALRAARAARRCAGLDGEVRARLLRLHKDGVPVHIAADPAGAAVPGIDPATGGARMGARRFDLALLAAGAAA